MSKNTGGPAFPTTDFLHAGQVVPGSEGMTLRDYFAAKAMQAVITCAFDAGAATEAEDALTLAEIAYVMADAMLAEREK